MNDNEALFGVFAFVALAICLFIGGCVHGENNCERDAIKHGAASYVITDPATGATEFRWKEREGK